MLCINPTMTLSGRRRHLCSSYQPTWCAAACVASRLRAETGDRGVFRLYMVADSLHGNFYGAPDYSHWVSVQSPY